MPRINHKNSRVMPAIWTKIALKCACWVASARAAAERNSAIPSEMARKAFKNNGRQGGFLVTFVRLLWVSTLKICNKKLVAAFAKSHSRICDRNGTCGAIPVQITKVPCVVPGISARAVFHWFHLASWPTLAVLCERAGAAAILRAPWRRATLSTAALRDRRGLSARRGTQMEMILLTARISSFSQSLAINGSPESERAS